MQLGIAALAELSRKLSVAFLSQRDPYGDCQRWDRLDGLLAVLALVKRGLLLSCPKPSATNSTPPFSLRPMKT
jgi:hypothetical protein